MHFWFNQESELFLLMDSIKRFLCSSMCTLFSIIDCRKAPGVWDSTLCLHSLVFIKKILTMQNLPQCSMSIHSWWPPDAGGGWNKFQPIPLEELYSMLVRWVIQSKKRFWRYNKNIPVIGQDLWPWTRRRTMLVMAQWRKWFQQKI